MFIESLILHSAGRKVKFKSKLLQIFLVIEIRREYIFHAKVFPID